MDISLHDGNAVFKTEFNEGYNLMQVFRGLYINKVGYTLPVDFHAAGLQKKTCTDIWHMDTVLALSTDECPPQYVCESFIGGNHDGPFAVKIRVKHDKDFSDIGSLWQDESGIKWTLLKVFPDELILMSENIGTNEEYKFKTKTEGNLTYVNSGEHTSKIITTCQQRGSIGTMNSYIKKDVVAVMPDGKELVNESASGCERAYISEEYNILDATTVCEYVTANRPVNGYTEPVNFPVGEPLFNCKIRYNVLSDGTVLVEFENTVLKKVNYKWCMGIMYQEKCDVYGEGIYRYIPKLKPIEEEGKKYDFSIPYNTNDGMFDLHTTPEYWENPDSPPDRQIDFIKKYDKSNLVAFAGGYLPLFDGKPEIRKNIKFSNFLIKTKKTYPMFANGEFMTSKKGVGYRKYFDNKKNSSSVYTVLYGDGKYIYADFYAPDAIELEYGKAEISVIEKSAGVTIETGDKTTRISADRGYAVLFVGGK